MREQALGLALAGVTAGLLLSSPATSRPSTQPPDPAIRSRVPPINPAMPSDEFERALDGYLADLAARGEFAGVVLIARDGRTRFARGYGLAIRETRDPVTTGTKFNIASIGKAFTRTAVGQLVGNGRLALSDTVASRLPAYPQTDARNATIQQLLDHRGGVVDFFGPRFDSAPKEKFASNADYFAFVAPEPTLFAPGSRRQYCNGCYIVLGEIVAAVAGMPYERYVEQHIFRPAGMTGAGFQSYGDPGVATGYTTSGGGALRPTTGMHGRRGSAAGGAFARAADLLAFDNALRERRLLDAKTTAWYLQSTPVETGRSPGGYGIAGGAPGANAIVESDGTWTIVVVGNLDPPNASRVGGAIRKALR